MSNGALRVQVSSGAATTARIFNGPADGAVAARWTPANRHRSCTPGIVARTCPSGNRTNSHGNLAATASATTVTSTIDPNASRSASIANRRPVVSSNSDAPNTCPARASRSSTATGSPSSPRHTPAISTGMAAARSPSTVPANVTRVVKRPEAASTVTSTSCTNPAADCATAVDRAPSTGVGPSGGMVSHG
jgi:hypothetical protein